MFFIYTIGYPKEHLYTHLGYRIVSVHKTEETQMTTAGLTNEKANEFMQLVTIANSEQLIAMKRHIETQLLIRGDSK
jgi:hypothetical protein